MSVCHTSAPKCVTASYTARDVEVLAAASAYLHKQAVDTTASTTSYWPRVTPRERRPRPLSRVCHLLFFEARGKFFLCRSRNFSQRHHLCLQPLRFAAGSGRGCGGNDPAVSKVRETDSGSTCFANDFACGSATQRPYSRATASTERERVAADRGHWIHQSAEHSAASVAAQIANLGRASSAARERAARREVAAQTSNR